MKKLFLALVFAAAPLGAEAPARLNWTMQADYAGRYKASYDKLKYEIPPLIRQTTLDVAVRCGLDFQEGWSVPLEIRFVEDAPGGVENILAYVQMQRDTETGAFVQTLNINLAYYQNNGFTFERVFAHELVHAMLNDALKERSLDLPVWFHEGLAVYGANQGDQLIRAILAQYPNANESSFLNGLEGPHGAMDYMEDYLAFAYIHDHHGADALHNFIRDVIARNGDIPGALNYTLHETWDDFQKNAHAYSEEQLFTVGRNLRSRTMEKAY
jgi:hypothetical protein